MKKLTILTTLLITLGKCLGVRLGLGVRLVTLQEAAHKS